MGIQSIDKALPPLFGAWIVNAIALRAGGYTKLFTPFILSANEARFTTRPKIKPSAYASYLDS